MTDVKYLGADEIKDLQQEYRRKGFEQLEWMSVGDRIGIDGLVNMSPVIWQEPIVEITHQDNVYRFKLADYTGQLIQVREQE